MKHLSLLALACAVSSPALAFDWQQLIPPPSGGTAEDDAAATGSAATRGIDEGGKVARVEGDAEAVIAIEAAEPREDQVAKFVERAGLALGRAPDPEPRVEASASTAMSGGLGILQAIDPSGYAGAASQAAKGMIGLSPGEERELGRRIAAQVLAQYGRDADADAEEYVNLVAAVVGRSSDRPELHYHVGVLATDEVNAFSAPGGYLFVTRGALRLMEDEAELAGVLAHEVAHVTERHILSEIRRANLLGGALSVARTKGFSAEQFGVMADFGKNLLSKGLSRKDELGADSHGASFAARAGYGSKGLTRFLERLREREGGNRGGSLFRTHPPASERLATLSAAAEASAGGDKPLADRFRRFLPAS